MVTLQNIIELFSEDGAIQIWVDGDIYEFPYFSSIPDEVLNIGIESIDNPFYNTTIGHPLCVNFISDDFYDYKSFKEEFKDYLISE